MSKTRDYDKLRDAVIRMNLEEFNQLQATENLDPNSTGEYNEGSLLAFAIREFKFDHADSLLRIGAIPDAQALSNAIAHSSFAPKCYDLMERFLQSGIKPDHSSLCNAIANHDLLKLMLETYNIDINTTNEDGNTVLVEATKQCVWDQNNSKVLDLIFKYGGDLNIKNNAGHSMFAQIFKSFSKHDYDKVVDIFKLLLPHIHFQGINHNEVIDSGNLLVEVLVKHGIKDEIRQKIFQELIVIKTETGQSLFDISPSTLQNIFCNDPEAMLYYTNILQSYGYKMSDNTTYHKTNSVILITGFDIEPEAKKVVKYSEVSNYFASEDDTLEIEIEPGFKKLNDQLFSLFGQNKNVKFLSLGDGQTDIYENSIYSVLESAAGLVKVNPSNSTLLLLNFHGNVITDEVSGQKTHIMTLNKHNFKIKTADLFKKINDIFQKPVDIILTSCKSGVVKDLVDLLPIGSKLVQFCSGDENVPSTSYLVNTIASFAESDTLLPENITVLDIVREKFLNTNDSSGINPSSKGTNLPVVSISGSKLVGFETFCENKIELEIKDGIILNCAKIDKELVKLFTEYWNEVVQTEDIQNVHVESIQIECHVLDIQDEVHNIDEECVSLGQIEEFL